VKSLSINKTLKNGFQIGNEDIIFNLSKDSIALSFDRVLNPRYGFVSGIHLNPKSIKTAGNVVKRKKYEFKSDKNKLHKIIVNCGKSLLHKN
jgi:hypothetical protein